MVWDLLSKFSELEKALTICDLGIATKSAVKLNLSFNATGIFLYKVSVSNHTGNQQKKAKKKISTKLDMLKNYRNFLNILILILLCLNLIIYEYPNDQGPYNFLLIKKDYKKK